MTYREQLAHPNWQKRRLEVLSAKKFTCECCGDEEKTLHVHHRRYVKGRKAWEYQDWELAVLCNSCHEFEHHVRERLSFWMAVLGVGELERLEGCAIGISMSHRHKSPHYIASAEVAEGLADFMGNLNPDHIISLLDEKGCLTFEALVDYKQGKAA
jgi:hypothetical protein